MASTFLSPEWIGDLRSELAGDAAIESAAGAWPFGPVLLVVQADGEHVSEPMGVLLDLRGGRLADVGQAPAAADRVPTAFSGGLARWKSIAAGQQTLHGAVLRAQLAFRGDLPAVTRHELLFHAIASALGRVETTWQDEVAAADAVAAKA